MAGKQEGGRESSTAELVALILGRLAGTRGGACREEDVRRVLAKRRRKWRQRHSLRNSECHSLTPELIEEKQSLMLLCEELKDTLVKRRREAFDRARETRRTRNSLTIGVINEQLECSRKSLESYQQSHSLSVSREVGSQQDVLREQMGEELLQDLEINISQAKTLSFIQRMKLHMTPHNLSQWSPAPAIPDTSLMLPPEQAQSSTIAERDGQSMADPLGGMAKMSPSYQAENSNLAAVAGRDSKMADSLEGERGVMEEVRGRRVMVPPESNNLTAIAERDDKMADLVGGGGGDVTAMLEEVGGGREVIEMSPPEQPETTTVAAKRDSQSMADPLGGEGETIVMSSQEQAENGNLTAVAERGNQMADSLGREREAIEMTPPESNTVVERDGQSVADPSGGMAEATMTSSPENSNLTAVAERDDKMADSLGGGRGDIEMLEEVIEMAPPESNNLTAVAERDDKMADLVGGGGGDVTVMSEEVGGGREVIEMSPPEQPETTTAAAERDSQSMADPLGEEGETIVMSSQEQAENGNLTAVAERGNQMADSLGREREVAPTEQAETTTVVAERDSQSMAAPLGERGETIVMSSQENNHLTERDNQMADPLGGGREMAPSEQAESSIVTERDGHSMADPSEEEGEIIELSKEVGGGGEEILCEDKVPDVARVVEGTTEELNNLCSIQHGLEDTSYIHQTVGRGSTATETVDQQEFAPPHKNGLVTYDMCGGGEVTVLEGEMNEDQNPAVGCEMEIKELSSSSLELDQVSFGKKNDKLENQEMLDKKQEYSNGQVFEEQVKESRLHAHPPSRRGRKRKLKNSSVASPGGGEGVEAQYRELCRKVVEKVEVLHSSVKPKRPRGRPPKKRGRPPRT